MAQFLLLDLPIEVQAFVFERVAKNNYVDLYRLASCCKSMRTLAECRGVYASFDLYKYNWNIVTLHALLRRCFEEGSASTLYIKGVEYFYRADRHEEGLALIKRAADTRYQRALYTYAMTRKIFFDDDAHFSHFTRESVGEIGRLVRAHHWEWNLEHNDAFQTKKYVISITVVPLFYCCPCSLILDQDWDFYHIEDSKAEDMCNRCVWIKETAIFLRDFKPSTDFPDFYLWQ